MAASPYLLIAVLIQLVAVPTLTTPSPLARIQDQFADELENLEDLSKDTVVDEAIDFDDLKKIADDVGDLEELVDFDDDIINADINVEDLIDELLDESDEEVEDELANLSDLGDITQTIIPDRDADLGVGLVDDFDDAAQELSRLAGLNSSAVNEGPSTVAKEANAESDTLVEDLMDVVQENPRGGSDVETPGPDYGNDESATATLFATDVDYITDDYELVTEITMVTELQYDVVPEDAESVDDNANLITLSTVEGVSLASTDIPSDDQPTIMISDVEEYSTVLTATETVTEFETKISLVTEFETETNQPVDDLLEELRDLASSDNGGTVDDVSMTTLAILESDENELELELAELNTLADDLPTFENILDDDDEPTFVVTSPYPSVLGSTETLDLGPDLTTTIKKLDKECPTGQHACADGSQCVVEDTLCDLMMDCPDGSDEDPNICRRDRMCPAGFMRCGKSPQCVRDADWCDGVFHCYNGADEHTCMTCMGVRGEVRYLMMEDFCDGVQDCDDNHDETSERCDNPCPSGFSKCGDDHQCIKDELVCDGFINCRDGSDEGKHCERSMVECEAFGMFACDGICMVKPALCDNTPDCKDGVDEKGCTKDIFSCPEDFTLSRKTSNCIHRSITGL